MLISNRSIIFYVVGVFLFILVGFGISYAYYSVNADNYNDVTSSEILTTVDKSITFSNLTNIDINTNRTDVYYKKFIVKNNYTGTVPFNIVWKNVENGVSIPSKMYYTLTCTSYTDYESSILSSSTCDGLDGLYELPMTGEEMTVLKPNININKGETYSYELVLYVNKSDYVQNFKADVSISTSGDISDKRVLLEQNKLGDKILKDYGDGSSSNENALFKTIDQDGDTYYYYGSNENNYILLSGMLFKVVRINGDGTIRLVLNDYAKDKDNNDYLVSYNNDTCNSENINTCGIFKIDIDSKLNEWFRNSISEYDLNYVVSGKYCNDYSYKIVNNNILFNSYDRITNNTPSLTCSLIDGASGNVNIINSMVGILSVDEAFISGKTLDNDAYQELLLTPREIKDNNLFIFSTNGNSLGSNSGTEKLRIKPVINVKSDVNVIGEGTISSPYVISGIAK